MSFMLTGKIKIYQFKVYLKGISPQVIRRIPIRSDTTLARFHGILQVIMGWQDEESEDTA
jgi:pRiA4b ORF-3-like protein